MCVASFIDINTLRPRLNGRHFADDIFKCIFLNENAWISLKISLKFVPKVRINNVPTLVQIKAWRRPGDKPLSEPVMVSLRTHICVTRPQWVNRIWTGLYRFCLHPADISQFMDLIWGNKEFKFGLGNIWDIAQTLFTLKQLELVTTAQRKHNVKIT